MFNIYAYAAIDAVQNSKKSFVDTFVKNEAMADVLKNFVDAQTKYTKAAVDAGIKTATDMSVVVSNKDFLKDMTETVKSFVPTFKAK